ncbi:MAG TPA: hypothetical protein VMG39_09605 [Pseudolabrys sp.]|nr:hypothetical protein [Pseudolabrys sp.]
MNSAPPSTRWLQLLLPFACALVVIGAHYWLIAYAASPTPFDDQWAAEAAKLYPHFFNGTLGLSDLIASHGEHRLLMTRLWSLLLLELDGSWDSILQMLANTLVLGVYTMALITAFRPLLSLASWMVFASFVAFEYALPCAWATTIFGFDSQRYFVLLFSFVGLVVMAGAPALTLRWWLAVLLIVASYFSMASGTATAAAAAVLCALQIAVGRRTGWREWPALALLAALIAGMVLAVPPVVGDEALRAHSVGHFIEAFTEVMSWPAAIGITFVPIRLLGMLLLNWPAWLVSLEAIRTRPPLSDRRWLVAALSGWIVLHAGLVAYGRAVAPVQARYVDIIMLGLAVNAACLLYLSQKFQIWRRWRPAAVVAALWLLPLLIGLGESVFKQAIPAIAERRADGLVQTENLRAYLESGDIGALLNKTPLVAIPYGDPQRLAELAASPVIRPLLPAELVGQASVERAQQNGLARWTGHAVASLKSIALRWGALLIPLGLFLFASAAILQWRRGRFPLPSQLPP